MMELSSEIILIATKNEGKVQEFAHAFAKLGKRVVSLNEYPEFAILWRMAIHSRQMRELSEGGGRCLPGASSRR
ncbi:hypothetical protein BBD42_00005 [Paenibacillus sp. BIHB 4019]|uniref:Non-canonical purine NTP pyrophosphatase n=1 Tax=Paenibacillus sp. BIHB 4019 TaxID=1870819 RepID=A0A1B2DBF7_9BACL|nr:hypothetical protein BBD42_00005 [Paenibacillus sp. BIHB 4019]